MLSIYLRIDQITIFFKYVDCARKTVFVESAAFTKAKCRSIAMDNKIGNDTILGWITYYN